MLTKLCKNSVLNIQFDSLSINPKLLKSIVCFLMDNGGVSIGEDYLSNVSENNRSFCDRLFKKKVHDIKDNICDEIINRSEFSIVDQSEISSKMDLADDYVIY